MFVLRAGIDDIVVRIANSVDSDQIASSEAASDLGLHFLSRLVWQATGVQNLRAFTVHRFISNTVKPVLSGHLKIDKTRVLMENGS